MLRTPPRYSDPRLPPLDDADRRIIDLLVVDGRASGRELAQQTGLSEANVSRRLSRLVQERSVRIVGFVPPEYLGLSTQFVTRVRVRGDVDAAAAELLKHPEFCYVTGAFGPWDILVYGVVQDTRALVALQDRALHGNPFFRSVETEVVLEFPDPSLAADATGRAREIDSVDRQIIRQVQTDGRISFTDIAQAVGISATSAADRFRGLAGERIVRIVALPDPSRIGLQLSGHVSISAAAPSREVIRRLSDIETLSFFSVFTGMYQIHAEFHVKDAIAFDALRARILAVEGVRDLVPSIHRRLYRQSFVWGGGS